MPRAWVLKYGSGGRSSPYCRVLITELSYPSLAALSATGPMCICITHCKDTARARSEATSPHTSLTATSSSFLTHFFMLAFSSALLNVDSAYPWSIDAALFGWGLC